MGSKLHPFPKLPDQDKFLLELQNNNYSMLTVLNYARDLCIFALFLKRQQIEFNKLAKENITIYKGYLRNGDHLRDLDRFRAEYVQKFGEFTEDDLKNEAIQALITTKGYKGPRTHESAQGATMTTPEILESSTGGNFLDNVYKKVFGSLGFYQKKIHRHKNATNSQSGLDTRSVNRMLSALRSYLKYRVDFDLAIPLAPDAIKLIKAERKKSQVADFEDLVRLIESPMTFERIRAWLCATVSCWRFFFQQVCVFRN